jgi:hypothetical protein
VRSSIVPASARSTLGLRSYYVHVARMLDACHGGWGGLALFEFLRSIIHLLVHTRMAGEVAMPKQWISPLVHCVHVPLARERSRVHVFVLVCPF